MNTDAMQSVLRSTRVQNEMPAWKANGKGSFIKKTNFLKRVFKKSFFFKACVWALPPKMLCSSMAKCARVTEKLLADILSFETDVSDFFPFSLIFSISLLTDNYYFSTTFFSIFYFSFSFLFCSIHFLSFYYSSFSLSHFSCLQIAPSSSFQREGHGLITTSAQLVVTYLKTLWFPRRQVTFSRDA